MLFTRTSSRVASVVFTLATSAPALAAEKVVVTTLKSDGLDKRVLAALDDLLVYAVSKQGGREVIAPSDIEAQLGLEKAKDALGCSDAACAAEIGGALGARYLLSGSARRLGKQLIVTLSLIDTSNQQVKRGQGKVDNDESLYEQAIRDALSTLFETRRAAESSPTVASGPAPASGGSRMSREEIAKVCGGYKRDRTLVSKELAQLDMVIGKTDSKAQNMPALLLRTSEIYFELYCLAGRSTPALPADRALALNALRTGSQRVARLTSEHGDTQLAARAVALGHLFASASFHEGSAAPQ